jgi:TPR repeat protein
MINLAITLLQGDGVPPDKAKGAAWLKKAAGAGDAGAAW